MVAKVQTKTVYKCEVCDKTHSTLKSAEKCETGHEETRLKLETEAKERIKLRDLLVEIRTTSESFEELQERALAALKEHYGDDFVLSVVSTYSRTSYYGRATCTYVLDRKVKRGDYYKRWQCDKEVSSDEILKDLGFKTGSGSGNGHVFHWEVNYNIEDFPGIQAKMLERYNAVSDCEHQMEQSANKSLGIMRNQEKYADYLNEEQQLEIKIALLREQLRDVSAEKQQYIKENFYKPYEDECSAMIAALPQQFRGQYKDPEPLHYFSFD